MCIVITAFCILILYFSLYNLAFVFVIYVISYIQKFREYLEGSNLISKLQAKHDILKKALAEGKSLSQSSLVLYFVRQTLISISSLLNLLLFFLQDTKLNCWLQGKVLSCRIDNKCCISLLCFGSLKLSSFAFFLLFVRVSAVGGRTPTASTR